MKKVVIGLVLLILSLILVPLIITGVQGYFVPIEHHLSSEQTIWVGWAIVGSVVLFNTVKSWIE